MTSDKDADTELAAMASVLSALKDLDPEVQERVLRWAGDRLGVESPIGGKKDTRLGTPGTNGERPEFTDFASLHEAAGPETDANRALVAGYWFQVIRGQAELDAQALNAALKNLGHRIANITEALTSLKSTRPALVIQTQKKGTTRQARKKYKLTTAGVKAVEAMLAPSRPHEG